MIIFLYGQDTYKSKQKLQEIVASYQKIHKSGLNLKYFNDKKTNFQDFKDKIQTSSMFKEKKLIILENIFSNPQFKNSFLENSKKFIDSDDVILFYEDDEVPRSDRLFKFLEKNAETQNFKLLDGQRLRNWLKKEFEGHQAKIEPKALEKLIVFVGNDLWQLSQEVKKLTAFKNREKIETRDVELLVKPKTATDIFRTIDAIALKNKKEALSLIHKHLTKGDSHSYLLYMINFQFRNLLIVKDLAQKHYSYNILAKMSHLHPYVFKKSYWQAEKFTSKELKKIYQKIFQVDLAIKTGKIDPEAALDLLIVEI